MEEKEYRLKRFDLLAKIFLGFIGAAITVFLGMGQQRLADIQQHSADKHRLDQLEIAKGLSGNYFPICRGLMV